MAAEVGEVPADASADGGTATQGQATADEGDAGTAPPVSFYGSITARFSDNLCLALSSYGDSGCPSGVERPQPEAYSPPPTRPASTDVKDSPGKGKGRKGQSPTPAPTTAVPETAREDEGAAEAAAGDTARLLGSDGASGGSHRFQKLFVSTPDGAQFQYMLEGQAGAGDAAERRLVVKMRRSSAHAGEVSRLVTCEGHVMRVMADGTSQVLFPDGTVAESCPGAAAEGGEADPPDGSPRQNRAGTGKSGRGDESPSRRSESGREEKRKRFGYEGREGRRERKGGVVLKLACSVHFAPPLRRPREVHLLEQ